MIDSDSMIDSDLCTTIALTYNHVQSIAIVTFFIFLFPCSFLYSLSFNDPFSSYVYGRYVYVYGMY